MKQVNAMRGFSLIELIVVLVLLGLLAAVVVPNMIHRGSEGRHQVARIALARIDAALEVFQFDTGRYPTSSEGLAALVQDPAVQNWRGPYLKRESSLRDPWGRPFEYRAPGQHGEYDLWSLGADGQEGGTGADEDIESWK